MFLFQVSQKELKDALRRQWSQLSDKRRLKWISKALELQKDYEVPERREAGASASAFHLNHHHDTSPGSELTPAPVFVTASGTCGRCDDDLG